MKSECKCNSYHRNLMRCAGIEDRLERVRMAILDYSHNFSIFMLTVSNRTKKYLRAGVRIPPGHPLLAGSLVAEHLIVNLTSFVKRRQSGKVVKPGSVVMGI